MLDRTRKFCYSQASHDACAPAPCSPRAIDRFGGPEVIHPSRPAGARQSMPVKY